jgi:predicted protein tyrosine phosphatase
MPSRQSEVLSSVVGTIKLLVWAGAQDIADKGEERNAGWPLPVHRLPRHAILVPNGQSPLSPMKNLLFICSRNRLRSPTAEQIFSSRKGVETDSAGLAPDAAVLLTGEQLEWATHIFVMEKGHKTKLLKQFAEYVQDKKIICLGIADDYDYMDPALMQLLEAKVGPYLKQS